MSTSFQLQLEAYYNRPPKPRENDVLYVGNECDRSYWAEAMNGSVVALCDDINCEIHKNRQGDKE